jgi:hypothetical protein
MKRPGRPATTAETTIWSPTRVKGTVVEAGDGEAAKAGAMAMPARVNAMAETRIMLVTNGWRSCHLSPLSSPDLLNEIGLAGDG